MEAKSSPSDKTSNLHNCPSSQIYADGQAIFMNYSAFTLGASENPFAWKSEGNGVATEIFIFAEVTARATC